MTDAYLTGEIERHSTFTELGDIGGADVQSLISARTADKT